MIISHQHKFIFIKTIKTAGTSLEIALSEHCGPQDIITPISYEDEAVRQEKGFRGPQNYQVSLHRLTSQDWKKYLLKKERPAFYNHIPANLIRRYCGTKTWNSYFKFCIERNPYDKAISRYYWDIKDMENPRELNDYILHTKKAAFSNWILYTIDNQLVVNYVVRYENLEADLAKACSMAGLPPLNLPRVKAGLRKDNQHYSRLLDEEARSYIARACRHEIETFGYRFEEE